MTTNIDARNLVLKDVHRLLKLERQFNGSFTSLLELESLTEIEQQRLTEIRHNFERYYEEGKILEGEVKFLFVSPLMWLSGFYSSEIRISLEEGIADIQVEDENIVIKGRMDILVAKRERNTILSILIIEAKNSTINASEGLPQLLTYAHASLDNQDTVWGLTTNGMDYQFVFLQSQNPPIYQISPKLDLTNPEQSIQILQILKTICQPYLI